MTNMIVTAMLLLGGAAVVNGLTGMDISLAAFLIPVGVMIYTLVGGLKATFVADYMHTIIIFIVILTFVATVYFVSPLTGGIEGMYEKLTEAAALRPVEGNAMGMYLTMASLGGLIFGIINIVGNFGTVFVDQAYWQRAIAAQPTSTVKGFLLGGACWFAIPFTLATTMGLTAVALGVDLTPEQVQLGLTVPAAASVLMGEVGAVLVLTMLFMAVTSAGSAELIAVSSLITYDVYRTYKNPNASGKKLLKVSRATIVGFGLGMGGLAVILLSMGLSLGFVYLAMGVLIGSAVIPIALTITWKRTDKVAATAGAIIGLFVALGTWIGVAASLPAYGGEVSLASLGDNYSMLFGNIAGILTGGAIAGLGSLARRTTFDWSLMRERIKLVDMSQAEVRKLEEDEETLAKAFKFSLRGGGIMTLVLIIAWPMPLFFAGYVFDIAFYSFWGRHLDRMGERRDVLHSGPADNRGKAGHCKGGPEAEGAARGRRGRRRRCLVAHCSGCGVVLGWKKYKFQRMWRVPGYYCRQCMLELGRDFDRHARITLPTVPCALCGVGYYFLKGCTKGGGKRHMYCKVCHEAVSSGAVPAVRQEAEQAGGGQKQLKAPPRNLPLVMMIFAGLGALMMVMGLVFTMMSTGDDANVANILFGSVTTALGFVLLRKTLKSRSLLLGRAAAAGQGGPRPTPPSAAAGQGGPRPTPPSAAAGQGGPRPTPPSAAAAAPAAADGRA